MKVTTLGIERAKHLFALDGVIQHGKRVLSNS